MKCNKFSWRKMRLGSRKEYICKIFLLQAGGDISYGDIEKIWILFYFIL
jgi:hypothetical protein